MYYSSLLLLLLLLPLLLPLLLVLILAVSGTSSSTTKSRVSSLSYLWWAQSTWDSSFSSSQLTSFSAHLLTLASILEVRSHVYRVPLK